MANYAFMDVAREAGLSDSEIAALVVAYEDYNYDEDEILEMIENGNVTTYGGFYDYGENVDLGDMDFYVFDSYDDAYAGAKESIIDLFDDIGIEGFNVNIEDYVDSDWFYDAMRESQEFYLNDLSPEELFETAYDNGFLDESDFDTDEDGDIDFSSCNRDFDDVAERMLEDWEEAHDEADAVQDYIDNFGTEDFNYVVKKNNLIDVDRLAEDCIDVDGVALTIASYDSYEHEVDIDGVDYYVYRHN